MLKQIPVSQLKTGMFLHAIDINLSLFPEIQVQSTIADQNNLQNIIQTGVKEAIIDTAKGSDIEEAGLKTLKQQLTITHARKKRRAIPPPELPELSATPYKEELETAKRLKHTALSSLKHAFSDIKMGISIQTQEVKQSVKLFTDSIIRNQDALLTLGQIRNKNSYIYDHAINTCVLVIVFCKWKNIDYDTTINMGIAALLHDMGETRLDDNLIAVKGDLDEQQYIQMQQHVKLSVDLLSSFMGIHPQVVKLVKQHHERLDGSGYPDGLSGDEIDPLAQILGMIDLYDSMTADTMYSYAQSPTQVLKQLLESHDEMFDSVLIKQFIKCIGIYPVGSLVKLSNGCIAIINEISHHDALHPKVKMIYNARQEHFIQPVDVDLSELVKKGQAISIKGCIDPNLLHINLAAFI